MRLVTFETPTPLGRRRRVGALLDDGVVDVNLAYQAVVADGGQANAAGVAALEAPAEMLEFLGAGESAMDAARAAIELVRERGPAGADGAPLRHPLSEVRLLAPLPRPNSLRDYMVVENHVLNAMKSVPAEWYTLPVYYKGNVDEVYGPDDVVPWPAYTEKLDYELEVCAVIGRAGRGIARDAAAAHIAGYTLFNDWSARDIQFREMSVGLGPSMGKDFANSFGPCIVTPDEFDRDHANLKARIDGEVWSSGVLGKMHFSFEEIVEWTSQEQTLRPGDMLGSGTVGRGCGLEIDRWIRPGCTVELEADGIGVLRNRVGVRAGG